MKKQSDELSEVIQNFVTFIKGNSLEITSFKWDERFRLNIGPMDDEHLILIEKMNLFLAALNTNQMDNIKETFDALATYTVKHFTDEERKSSGK